MLLTMIFLALQSKSMFFSWVMMEMIMLMFIALPHKLNTISTSSMMKYFIMQSLSSSVIIFTYALSLNLNNCPHSLVKMVIFTALWMKLGMFPFNAWYFQVSENMEWTMWFLLNSTQKLIPLFLLSSFFNNWKWTLMMIMTNNMYSTVEMWHQTSIRWAMNCSSLNHLSWIILSMNFSYLWEIYLMFYITNLMSLMIFLKKNNINSTMNATQTSSTNSNMMMWMLMMNFMGIPPFFGFIPKLMIIVCNNSLLTIMIMLMINSMISLMYLYYNWPIMKKSTKNPIKETNSYNNSLMIASLSSLTSVFTLMMI